MDPLHDISKPINLNYFASEQWVRTLGFLRKHFNLSDDDCKDVFQESFIILYDQICAGKLDELTSSLSTYFLAICRNKALPASEQVETKGQLTATPCSRSATARYALTKSMPFWPSTPTTLP